VDGITPALLPEGGMLRVTSHNSIHDNNKLTGNSLYMLLYGIQGYIRWFL